MRYCRARSTRAAACLRRATARSRVAARHTRMRAAFARPARRAARAAAPSPPSTRKRAAFAGPRCRGEPLQRDGAARSQAREIQVANHAARPPRAQRALQARRGRNARASLARGAARAAAARDALYSARGRAACSASRARGRAGPARASTRRARPHVRAARRVRDGQFRAAHAAGRASAPRQRRARFGSPPRRAPLGDRGGTARRALRACRRVAALARAWRSATQTHVVYSRPSPSPRASRPRCDVQDRPVARRDRLERAEAELPPVGLVDAKVALRRVGSPPPPPPVSLPPSTHAFTSARHAVVTRASSAFRSPENAPAKRSRPGAALCAASHGRSHSPSSIACSSASIGGGGTRTPLHTMAAPSGAGRPHQVVALVRLEARAEVHADHAVVGTARASAPTHARPAQSSSVNNPSPPAPRGRRVRGGVLQAPTLAQTGHGRARRRLCALSATWTGAPRSAPTWKDARVGRSASEVEPFKAPARP